MLGSPKEGYGYRNIDCNLYKECLDHVVEKDWDGFNCEDCTYKGEHPGDHQGPNKRDVEIRLCSKCKERPTLSPSCPYCPSCMSKRAKKAKKTKCKSFNKPKKQTEVFCMTETKKPPQNKNTTLTIDFEKYPDILKRIEELAKEDVRPVDLQAIYMLKNSLKSV